MHFSEKGCEKTRNLMDLLSPVGRPRTRLPYQTKESKRSLAKLPYILILFWRDNVCFPCLTTRSISY